MERNEESLQDSWDMTKRNNVHIIGAAKRRIEEEGVKSLLK